MTMVAGDGHYARMVQVGEYLQSKADFILLEHIADMRGQRMTKALLVTCIVMVSVVYVIKNLLSICRFLFDMVSWSVTKLLSPLVYAATMLRFRTTRQVRAVTAQDREAQVRAGQQAAAPLFFLAVLVLARPWGFLVEAPSCFWRVSVFQEL